MQDKPQPTRPGSERYETFASAPAEPSADLRARLQPKRILLSLALLATLGYGLKFAYGWVTHGRFLVETDDAYVEADTTIIASELSAAVAEVPVADNTPVRVGDVLVRLADTDFRARLTQAEGALATQKAALANVDARLKWQRSMIKTAEAGVATARSDLERTRADYDRYAKLHTDRIASAQRYEAARSEAEKARAAELRANAGLQAEHDQLAILDTQRTQTIAQIAQAEAALEVARIELARTVIRAPIYGVVGNRGVQVGQYVRPGVQLMSIVPIPNVRVVANFKETQIAGLRRGQPVSIAPDAWPGVKITGRVESFAPASGSRFSLLPPENATGNFTKIVQRIPVRIAIDPQAAMHGRLRPGLSVIVAIDRRHPGDGENADMLLPAPAPAPATSPAAVSSSSTR
jgi:membrane fusion protein (multidrug efflux system)